MSREARPMSTALRTPPGHASGVEASSTVAHVQFSYGLKGPQEAGSGCACRKKPHQHLLAPLWAWPWDHCWRDQVDTAEAALAELTASRERVSGDALGCSEPSLGAGKAAFCWVYTAPAVCPAL